jgi:hypothetical protein
LARKPVKNKIRNISFTNWLNRLNRLNWTTREGDSNGVHLPGLQKHRQYS